MPEVEVYWNITQRYWSIRDAQRGIVVAHAPQVCLRDAHFIVREGGRRRVLSERRKNVHAYVRGTIGPLSTTPQLQADHRIRYNPYVMTQFQWAISGQPVEHWPELLFTTNGQVYALNSGERN